MVTKWCPCTSCTACSSKKTSDVSGVASTFAQGLPVVLRCNCLRLGRESRPLSIGNTGTGSLGLVPVPISRKSTRKKFRSTQPATFFFFRSNGRTNTTEHEFTCCHSQKLSKVGFSKLFFRRPLCVVDTVVATVLASFPSQLVMVTVVTRMHAHCQIRDIDQSQASRSRDGGDDDEFLSRVSELRSNEMEVVGVSPPLSKRPMLQLLCWMVVCAIAGMRQGKSRAQQVPVRKPFADLDVRKCVGAPLVTLLTCCRNLFQLAAHLEDAVVLVISLTRTRRCQQVYCRMKRRQIQSESNEGDDKLTIRHATIIAVLGRTTQISIHIQPPSLLPTRLDIIPCFQLTSFRQKILERRSSPELPPASSWQTNDKKTVTFAARNA